MPALPLLVTAVLLALAPVRSGPRSGRQVALTFDACMNEAMARGGEPHYNRAVIDILQRTRTPATLFLSGLWIERNPREALALAQDPLFELGNHGHSHRAFAPRCFHLPALPADPWAAALEIDQPQRLLTGLLGRPPRWFRFAGGCATPRALRLLMERGLRPIGWDVYGSDGRNPDAAAIARAVLRGVRPGSIILLHMNGAPQAPRTAEALPTILQGLRARGLLPVPLRVLLGPPEAAQHRDAPAPRARGRAPRLSGASDDRRGR